MRVLHMGSPAGLYGAERWILALIRHLPTESVESIVGVIEDAPRHTEADLCRYAAKIGFETVQFRSHGKLSLSAIGQIRRFVRENKIDILHTHGYKTDIIGLLATRGTECMNLSTPHGWSVDAGIRLQVYEFLDRVSFSFMDVVAPLSPDLRDGLLSLPKLASKIRFIPNGVDLNEIDEVLKNTGDKKAGKDRFTVGYIGQLIVRKGVDTLIQAFQQLQVDRKELLIIGEGPQRNDLESYAANTDCNDQIQFLGFREDRIELLKSIDVFVLPSSLEGIPRCLMEAMGAGIPVIASNIPGCTELVRNNVTGILFDVGDVNQLAEALETIANDEGVRTKLACNGQELIRERYSATSMAESYSSLYRHLIEANRETELL